MIHTFIRQKVADYARWKSTFEANASWRMNSGEQDYQILRDVDDPSIITLVEGWDTFETAQNIVMSRELMRKMQDAGVIGEPMIYIMQDVESNQKAA